MTRWLRVIGFLLTWSVAPAAWPLAARPAATQPAADRPDVVLIVLDDLSLRLFAEMPGLQETLVAEGLTFANAVVAVPACCPSRASILRGQYAHNHGVLSNGPPNGGWEVFVRRGNEDSTLATWLQAAGYRTALVGKYLNGYEEDPKHVPPGWDRWYAWAGKGKYDRFRLSDNGRPVVFDASSGAYETDELGRLANGFIREAAAAGDPFFLYLAPHAPHEPATPAERHLTAPVAPFDPAALPAFNEADVGDKPARFRQMPALSEADAREIAALYERQQRAMLAAEEMVAGVIDTLAEVGRLDNTYIFFTSDNGFFYGEHRIAYGKGEAYEEALAVPLVVRGPGVPAGARTELVTSNIDLAPTIAELAGAAVPEFVDGRSLVPLLDGQPNGRWRGGVLAAVPRDDDAIDGEGGIELAAANPGGPPPSRILRGQTWVAIEHLGTGEWEFYDLRTDPFQLDNAWDTLPTAAQAAVKGHMAALQSCQADACRAAEDALPADATGLLGGATAGAGTQALSLGQGMALG